MLANTGLIKNVKTSVSEANDELLVEHHFRANSQAIKHLFEKVGK